MFYNKIEEERERNTSTYEEKGRSREKGKGKERDKIENRGVLDLDLGPTTDHELLRLDVLLL